MFDCYKCELNDSTVGSLWSRRGGDFPYSIVGQGLSERANTPLEETIFWKQQLEKQIEEIDQVIREGKKLEEREALLDKRDKLRQLREAARKQLEDAATTGVPPGKAKPLGVGGWILAALAILPIALVAIITRE